MGVSRANRAYAIGDGRLFFEKQEGVSGEAEDAGMKGEANHAEAHKGEGGFGFGAIPL